jgi:hypothetical protein
MSEQILPWTMDEFIHMPKAYLLLSTTFDEILSWIIEIWMKMPLVSDNNGNTVNSIIPQKNLQRMTNDVGLNI